MDNFTAEFVEGELKYLEELCGKTPQDKPPAKAYVIIKGNPSKGFTYIGPYTSVDEATHYVDSNGPLDDDDDWWVCDLILPTDHCR